MDGGGGSGGFWFGAFVTWGWRARASEAAESSIAQRTRAATIPKSKDRPTIQTLSSIDSVNEPEDRQARVSAMAVRQAAVDRIGPRMANFQKPVRWAACQRRSASVSGRSGGGPTTRQHANPREEDEGEREGE